MSVLALALLAASLLLSGCDPVARHKVITTIFEGVPSLPPAEDLCKEYHEQKVAAELSAATKGGENSGVVETVTHLPYEQKKCNDCHSENKDTNQGFVRPLQELCFGCHKGFIKGSFVHGPAAVGDCLACHLPHTSNNPALLKTSKDKLCEVCHREVRVAAGMHERLSAKQMTCLDCHNPHFGDIRYFLK